MNNHEQWLEQAEFYALGALTEKETADFEKHLHAGCSLCEALIKEAHSALSYLPKSLPAMAAPIYLKQRIMAQLDEGDPVAAGAGVSSPAWAPMFGILSLISLVVVLIWNVKIHQELKQNQEIVAMISNPQVKVVAMAGLEANPTAEGKVFWNPATRSGFVVITGLRQLPPDKIYELWAIADVPVKAALFSVDAQGNAIFKLDPLPPGKEFVKFAVSLEPAGGVSSPTGALYLAGAV
jgi:anti-sigma-K factor RskA